MPTLPSVTWSRASSRGLNRDHLHGRAHSDLVLLKWPFQKIICTVNFAKIFFNKYQDKDVIQLPYHFVFISQHHCNYPTHFLSSNTFREFFCRCLGVCKACWATLLFEVHPPCWLTSLFSLVPSHFPFKSTLMAYSEEHKQFHLFFGQYLVK